MNMQLTQAEADFREYNQFRSTIITRTMQEIKKQEGIIRKAENLIDKLENQLHELKNQS
jgi:hypothetical protein|tara:strand:+ start:1060 stop:1236 length:177 start_codon:yes stop_codon:yes gene_type:complete